MHQHVKTLVIMVVPRMNITMLYNNVAVFYAMTVVYKLRKTMAMIHEKNMVTTLVAMVPHMAVIHNEVPLSCGIMAACGNQIGHNNGDVQKHKKQQ